MNLKFTHIAHFKEKNRYDLNCTTCHYAIPQSTSLASLTLPKMIDCVACHDSDKRIAADFRMSNCKVCHNDLETTGSMPADHTRFVKPIFHTESFRVHHDGGSLGGWGEVLCVPHKHGGFRNSERPVLGLPSGDAAGQSSARWKDEVHGTIAAIDRQSCATCHTSDSCVRCHNILPSSHAPLALFKGGGHARLAMLDERACLTCHTFQNTCAECHTRGPH